MGGKMITNRFFFFDSQFRPRITRILQKTPEFQKMAIMISLSELIFVLFGVEQRIEGYERREKERGRERGGLRCDMLSCAVLSCAANNLLFYICCSKAVTFHNVFLHHVAVSSTSFTYAYTDTDTYTYTETYTWACTYTCACAFVCVFVCVVCMCLCF